jgi:hypothetical protein
MEMGDTEKVTQDRGWLTARIHYLILSHNVPETLLDSQVNILDELHENLKWSYTFADS